MHFESHNRFRRSRSGTPRLAGLLPDGAGRWFRFCGARRAVSEARRAMARLVTAGVLVAVASQRAVAQSHGLGPLVLRLPASARLAAMANAGLASNDGDALLYNPALLTIARGLSVSMQRYGSAATSGAMGTATQAGSLSLGIGVQFLQWSAGPLAYSDLLRSGASHLSDGGSVAASSAAFTVGVAGTVRGRRVGVSAKYAEDRIGNLHDGTAAFDAGVMLPSFGPGNLTFVAQNLGLGLRLGGERGLLPARVGFGYGGGMYSNYEHFDFGLQTQLTVEQGGFVRPAGGAELGYVPIEGVSLIIRGGLRLPREKDEPLATGGLGVTVDRISLDYAVEPFRGGRPVSHRLGLRIK